MVASFISPLAAAAAGIPAAAAAAAARVVCPKLAGGAAASLIALPLVGLLTPLAKAVVVACLEHSVPTWCMQDIRLMGFADITAADVPIVKDVSSPPSLLPRRFVLRLPCVP
jgi:hypothetical protein